MRLINTQTGRLEQFFDSQHPPYAILSHTWGADELSYFDLLYLTSSLTPDAIGTVQASLRTPHRQSSGSLKLEACCKLAKRRGFDWVWIDTSCIDKSSSAELSEAINSMWSWYHDAAECYVYLSDVGQPFESTNNLLASLSNARWFTRGWTLQELLAPQNVLFFNKHWEFLASKKQFAQQLSTITRIPLVFLDGTYDASNCDICSVAMKMSWLASRQTTRVEDMAYCMLGLFDVHMPLIYGEGRKAFMRLQLEILKKVDDDSIYAWTSDTGPCGLLATWPTAFIQSGNIVQISLPEDTIPWLPPTMTSLGLELKSRYTRYDPHQQAIDLQHGVQTLHTSIATRNATAMIMYCSPCTEKDIPITQEWGPGHRGRALLLYLSRFGSTWQRVNCDRLHFTEYSVQDAQQLNAFSIYYVKQQGL